VRQLRQRRVNVIHLYIKTDKDSAHSPNSVVVVGAPGVIMADGAVAMPHGAVSSRSVSDRGLDRRRFPPLVVGFFVYIPSSRKGSTGM